MKSMNEIIRVLVVEDTEDDYELIKLEISRRYPVAIFWRVQAEEALDEALRSETWDILISDYALPGFNGMRALERVLELQPSLPFIMVSGTITEDMAVEVMRGGARDFVLKDRLSRLNPAISREIEDTRLRKLASVTERALTKTLEQRESQLAEAQRIAQLGSWSWSIDTGDLSWSKELYRIYGKDSESFIPDLQSTMDLTHPSDRERVRSILEEMIRERRAYDLEFRIMLAEGEIKWVHSRADPVVDLFGRTSRYVGTIQDVTTRVTMEQAARESREQMQQLQKLDAIGRLAGGVAHDFNNLLAAIDIFCDLIMDDVSKMPKARSHLDEIKKSVMRGASLTRQLLMFSRKQKTDVRPVELEPLCQNMEKMLHRLLGSEIELMSKLSKSGNTIVADPSQLEQVVLNLVVNARDSMPEGGTITLNTETVTLLEPRAMLHSTLPAGRYAVLSVSDEGTGIEPGDMKKIFEPFFTTKPIGKGTGIGLSTVFGIVAQCNGAIDLSTEIGRGSVFQIYLPHAERKAKSALEQEREISTRSSGKILLVEDEEALRELYGELLANRGFDVITAKNGMDALGKFAPGSEIDLLVTDLMMPEMGGVALREKLLERGLDFGVLYMSGYADDAASVRDHLSSEKASFIQKPFSTVALVEKVAFALDQWERRRAV